MSITEKLKHEIIAVTALTLYFACWLGALMLLKYLLLAEYHIATNNMWVALIGALLLAKVVLVLEPATLGSWVRAQPAWVDVLLRTVLYAIGVFVLAVSEKAIEGWHEHGGLGASLTSVFRDVSAIHVWTNTICMSAALLSYNVLSVIRKRLGKGTLLRFLLEPLPEEQERGLVG